MEAAAIEAAKMEAAAMEAAALPLVAAEAMAYMLGSEYIKGIHYEYILVKLTWRKPMGSQTGRS